MNTESGCFYHGWCIIYSTNVHFKFREITNSVTTQKKITRLIIFHLMIYLKIVGSFIGKETEWRITSLNSSNIPDNWFFWKKFNTSLDKCEIIKNKLIMRSFTNNYNNMLQHQTCNIKQGKLQYINIYWSLTKKQY